MEIGHNQGEAIQDLILISGAYKSVEIKKDYNGHDRVAICSI